MSEGDKGHKIPLTRGRTLDYAAGVYDFLSPLMTLGQEGRLGKKAIGLLGLKGKENVLDVGCGTGTLTIEIARRLSGGGGSFVVGLDAGPKMIKAARRKGKAFTNLHFDIGIAEGLPYPDGFFNCAISTFFFHHLDFELKIKALDELWRVLKEGGRLAVVDVDKPLNLFGQVCAWSGYFLFNQEEIKENIQGKLEEPLSSRVFAPGRKFPRTWAISPYLS